MTDIVKTCKVHGNLSIDNIRSRKGKKSGSIRYYCYLCSVEGQKRSYEKHKENYKKRNLEYTRNNKDKIKKIRIKCRSKNREKFNEHYRIKYNIQCQNLDDNYIKMILCRYGNLSFKDITVEMIEYKRIALLIKRNIWKKKYGNS